METLVIGILLSGILNYMTLLVCWEEKRQLVETINRLSSGKRKMKIPSLKDYSGIKGKDWKLRLTLMNLIPGRLFYWLWISLKE